MFTQLNQRTLQSIFGRLVMFSLGFKAMDPLLSATPARFLAANMAADPIVHGLCQAQSLIRESDLRFDRLNLKL